jgi:hypothetical protein
MISYTQCRYAFKIIHFNLESAIKIIEYKSKLIKEEKKLENDSTNDEDIVDIVKNIKNKKSLKKSNE